MRISAKAQYGVRLMIALARNTGRGPIYLKDIAKDEDISEKYLSQIIIPLRRAGLVHSTRGSRGGYELARKASDINMREIVEVLEGSSLVGCIKDPSACSRAPTCASRDVWLLLGGKISETLGSVTLAELGEMNHRKLTVKPRGRIAKRGARE